MVSGVKRFYIFGLVALVFSVLYSFLIVQNRVPFAHDTFSYFQLQYVYYNEIVQNHSIPIWFPYHNMGGTGNIHFTSQTNLLFPLFSLLGLFVKSFNYLYLFYALLWFEELFFLLGVILLSSVYYKSLKTILFVSVTLLGTSIWYPQIWWNFHLFYYIPIVLYCLHKCLSTGLFRYLIFSILFFTLAVYSNFLYCAVFASFIIVVYVGLLILSNFQLLAQIKAFCVRNLKLKNIGILFALLLIVALSFSYIFYGGDQIKYIHSDRNSSGKNSLETFLTYGGFTDFGKYKEIVLRYGNAIDINLYAGFLLVPFALISLFYERKKISFVVGGVALVVFFFSVGILVSHLFYYVYPFGKIFRHIGLTATVCKLFLIFYAGFGFEHFLRCLSKDRKPLFLIFSYLIGLILIKPPVIHNKYFWEVSQLEKVYLLVVIYGVLFTAIIVLGLMYSTSIQKKFLVNVLLILVAIDLFSYKYSLIVTRMPRVSKRVIDLFAPYKYDFPVQRFRDTFMHVDKNERISAFYTAHFWGSQYDTVELFFYTDTVLSRYRTDFLLKAIYDFRYTAMSFPNNTHRVYQKYAGDRYSKLGVFSTLHLVADETDMGKIFAMKDSTGDMLFSTTQDVEGLKKHIPAKLIRYQNSHDFTNQHDRIAANIEPVEFSSNAFKLKVNVQGPADGSCFLYYADGYHPHWHADVNGKKTPVIRANIGFKAVLIPYGESEVTFQFGNAFYTLSIGCTLVVLSMVICITVFFFIREMREAY